MHLAETEFAVFVSEREGNDETGDGSEAKPFKTVIRAFREADVRRRADRLSPRCRCFR